jgi:catechol 2,3-dioxygenase-like lactoylglutathione lyase family enzyme
MGKGKGKLRHIAMSVPDPWKTAEFYKHAFGLEVVGETNGELAEGVFMSDGVINIAILKFRNDETAQGMGRDYVGLHHIGFWVDDAEETENRIKQAGGKWLMGEAHPEPGSFYEVKFNDPNGVIFDISHNGWGGAQKNPGAADNKTNTERHMVPEFEERRAAAAKELAEAVGD